MEARRFSVESFYNSIARKQDVYTSLEDFLSHVEEHSADPSKQDVVKEYIQFSGGCEEVKELTKLLLHTSAKDAVTLLKVLTCILARTASDLKAHSLLGLSLVTEILNHGIKSLQGFVNAGQKPSRVRCVLHLLASMIAQGPQAATSVFSKLSLASSNFTDLLNRSNPAEEEDIRGAFINVVLLLFTFGDNALIRQVVDTKGFLNSMFPGISSDKASVIVFFLGTLQSKVINNTAVSKTSKIRLFNDYTLKYVLQLYNWSGPTKARKGLKRKLGDDGEPQILEAEEAQIELVHRMAHKFLMALCTSYKTGIIFRDLSYGTSGRNQNHIITNLLSSFDKPHSNALACELIVAVLKVCPDQIKYFLPSLKDSLLPRCSVLWVEAIDLVTKVVESQDYVSCIFKSEEKKPVSKMVAVAKNICIPPVPSVTEITEALKNSHMYVCHKLLLYIASILNKTNTVLKFCESPSQGTLVSKSELKEFQNLFASAVKTALPDLKFIQNYWFRVTSMNSDDLQKDEEASSISQDVTQISYFEQLNHVLEVLKLFGSLYKSSSSSLDATFYYLFGGLKTCSDRLSVDEVCCLRLKLLDLFSYQDFFQNSKWSESLGMPPLAFVLDLFLTADNSSVSSRVLKTIQQLLTSFGDFHGEQWETDIWVKVLKLYDVTSHKVLLKFFNEIVQNLSNVSAGSSEEEEATDKCEFSGLVHSALLNLSSQQECKEDMEACRSYVQTCLELIMHHQHNPQKLLQVLKKYKNLFDASVFEYWKFLCSSKKAQQAEECSYTGNERLKKCKSLQEAFLSFRSGSIPQESNSHFVYLKKKLRHLNCDEIQWLTRQLLMYIGLDAKRLQANGDLPTAIPVYVQILEYFVSKSEVCGKEETLTSQEEPEKGSSSTSSFLAEKVLTDILSHPSILNCFLFISVENDESSAAVCVSEVVTDFVFQLMKSEIILSRPNDFMNIILPFKNRAIYFCQTNIGPSLNKDRRKNFKFAAFQKVVECFSFLFEPTDTVFLLQHLLSVHKDLLSVLDPKSCMLSALLDTYLREKQYIVLPSEVVRELFSRFVTLGKSKSRRVMKENMHKLLNRHPVYSLAVESDDVLALLAQETKSFLNILEILVSYNHSTRTAVKTAITDIVGSPEEHSGDFLMHLISMCLKQEGCGEHDVSFLHTARDFIWQYACSVVEQIECDSLYPLCDISHVLTALKETSVAGHKLLSGKKIQKLMENLFSKSEQCVPSLTKVPVLVNLICTWKKCSSFSSVKPCPALVLMSVNWLSLLCQKVEINDLPKCEPLTKVACTFLQNAEPDILREAFRDRSCWVSFVQTILKVALRSVSGVDLIKTLNAICKLFYSSYQVESGVFSDDIKKIHSLLISHSNFFTIMLDDAELYKNLKEAVIDLLVTLVQLASVCQEGHVSLLLASYTATLSPADQKLLYLLKLYEENGVDMSQFSPFLWGTPAITHYSVRKNVKLFLWKQPSMQEILRLFQEEMLIYTAVNFPLTLKLEPVYEISPDIPNCDPDRLSKMYDPRFVLPLVAVLLSPGAYVNCKSFVDSKVLGIVFASLSSYDPQMRALGYHCLSQFYSHLEGSLHGQRKIWISLLETVRNSIENPNPRLPCLISLFLFRAVNVIAQPGSRLYTAIYKFLTVKPNLDLDQVPEFYKLFNSNEVEHHFHRMWILTLLEEGIRGSLDFHLCQKRFIFTILLPFYSSSICTDAEKAKVLSIVKSVSRIYSSARTLCQSGLLPWLNSVVKTCGGGEILRILVDVLHVLWETSCSADAYVKQHKFGRTKEDVDVSVITEEQNCNCTVERSIKTDSSADQLTGSSTHQVIESSTEKKGFYLSFATEFLLVCFSLLEKLDLMDFESTAKYLNTFSKVFNQVGCEEGISKVTVHQHFAFRHAKQVYCKWKTFSDHIDTCFKGAEISKSHRDDSFYSNSEEAEKNVHRLFGEIIMHWHPKWSENLPEQHYMAEVTLYVNAACMMLLHLQENEHVLRLCSEWMLNGLENDSRKGMLSLLLSSDENSVVCLKLILSLWEKELKFRKHERPSKWTSIVTRLKSASDKTSCHCSNTIEILFSFLR